LNLTKGLGLIQAGIKVFVDTTSKEQRAAENRTLACHEEIMNKKMWSIPDQTTLLDFFKPSSGSRVLLDTGDVDDRDNPLTFQLEVFPPAPQIVITLSSLIFFVNSS
jgi:hypothetical protein